MSDKKLPQTFQKQDIARSIERSHAMMNVTQRILQKSNADEVWMQNIWVWADNFDLPEKVLPRNKDKLLSLKRLNFWGCNLTALTPEIYQLRQLEGLDLGNNKLLEIPSGIEALQNLKSLSLAENNLYGIPEDITLLDNLLSFMFRGNVDLELSENQEAWLKGLKDQGCYIFR